MSNDNKEIKTEDVQPPMLANETNETSEDVVDSNESTDTTDVAKVVTESVDSETTVEAPVQNVSIADNPTEEIVPDSKEQDEEFYAEQEEIKTAEMLPPILANETSETVVDSTETADVAEEVIESVDSESTAETPVQDVPISDNPSVEIVANSEILDEKIDSEKEEIKTAEMLPPILANETSETIVDSAEPTDLAEEVIESVDSELNAETPVQDAPIADNPSVELLPDSERRAEVFDSEKEEIKSAEVLPLMLANETKETSETVVESAEPTETADVTEAVTKSEDLEATAETPVQEDPTSNNPVAENNSDSKGHDEDFDSDHAEEDHDDESHEMEDDHHSPTQLDLSSMDKAALLAAAIESQNMTPRESLKRLQEIRPLYNELLRTERRIALEKFLEAGGEVEAFEFDDKVDVEKFRNVYNQAREARKEERERIEKEKLKNLALKKAILEKLSVITESDETGKSLSEVKEIQQEWKKIRVVPAENVKELWDSYHFYLDKFYDNHSINIELKELDRKKNLEIKIDLCKKVDELGSENSLKRSFILLNKYKDEFRNTGPVPKAYNDEIWERFQQACDKLYDQKKELFEQMEAQRTKHLELKEVLVEKAGLIAASIYPKQKDWKSKTIELDALMAEWKKVGPVPKSQNELIWKQFRSSFNTFYENKSKFFKQLNKDRKANLILKEHLCSRAEELKSSDDFSGASKELIGLQREWKEIGPVPEKVSNAIWKRFRASCDEFFERKNKKFAVQREEENNNLVKKKEVISKLEALLEQEKPNELLNTLKALQKEWNQIGFVPFKQKRDIENSYRKVSDKVFNKFKLDRQTFKSGQMQSHYKHLSELPSGGKRLADEEHKIRKKIGFLNGEIQTLENNMEFFGRSAGSQKLKKEIEEKIEKTRGQIDRLNTELKAIRGLNKPEKLEKKEESAAPTAQEG